MSSFELHELFWPVVAIFFTTLLLSTQVTKSPVASIGLAFVKSILFFIYFWFYFDGDYTFFDDWSYIEGGRELLHQGIGITNLIDNWEFVLMIGRGDHFLYYLYNAYSFRLFGDGYFAPVALNVILTVFIAYFGTKLFAAEFAINKQASKFFYLFLLLHPDVLVWSNIMNGKDILVLLLHVLLLFSVSLYFCGRNIVAFGLAVPVAALLLFLRFYVPIMFCFALLVGAVLFNWRLQLKYIFISMSAGVLMLFLLGEGRLQFVFESLGQNFVNPFYGFVRIVLTPIPFNVEEEYFFLNLPAFIHWILMPFVALGLVHVWRMKTHFSRFFIAYLLVFISLYAVYGELQGPRHRVQLDFAWAILQFVGVLALFGVTKLRTTSPSVMVAT